MNDSDKNDQKCYEVNSWDYAWVPTFCKKKIDNKKIDDGKWIVIFE